MPRRGDRANRSVRDYDSEHALRRALTAMEPSPDGRDDEGSGNPEQTPITINQLPVDRNNGATGAASAATDGDVVDADLLPAAAAPVTQPAVQQDADNRKITDLDWVVPSLDPDTTEVQSMKEELQRLLVLKSYMILDSEREATFERLTGLACRIFKVPIALVSVVDLGRIWFMSNRGLGDVRETPRRHAFCAHAIQGKDGAMLVVPDATQDVRFQDNPLVTGPPSIRFYAGASMISPEGYKLGTFCIIDDKTRPQGLTEDEQASLRDLADMAVKEMVDRHYKTKKQQSPAQLIAYTAHDLMTPLSGVQLSLSLLKEDEGVKAKLGYHQLELLSTAANCSDLMIRICQTAIDTLRQESIANKQASTAASAAAGSMQQQQQQSGSGIGGAAAADALPMTEMSELINSLAMVMEPIPKLAPLIITLDERVPPIICCDDLKLFRSALNLISNALPRTEIGAVHLHIFPILDERQQQQQLQQQNHDHASKLMFECSDTAPDIAVEEYQHLYKPSRVEEDGALCLGLSSVATLINSLAGEYGFRPLGKSFAAAAAADTSNSISSDGGDGGGGAELPLVPPPLQRTNTGSVFWFSVPLVVPDRVVSKDGEGVILPAVLSLHKKVDSFSGSLLERSLSSQRLAAGCGGGSNTSVSSTGKRRIPIIVGSVFDSGALQNSCFRDILPSNEGPGGSAGALGARLLSLSDIAAAARDGHGLDGDRKMPAIPRRISGLVSSSATAAVAAAGAAAAVAAARLSPSTLPAAARKRRALVIEDSLVVRKSLSRALDKMGFEVTQAVNGLEGLNRLKETLFDLVLCDFLMPVMDGMDCVKQYRDWERKHRSGFHQYIVGISAHATSNDGDQGIKAGMDLFKQKPISVRLLMEFQETDGFEKCSAMIDDMEPHASAAMVVDRELADDNMTSNDSSTTSRPVKRQKHDDEDSSNKQQAATPVCLLATDKPAKQSNEVLTNLEKNGWKIVIATDGQEALRLLQIRNWDAILIDDDIPLLAGTPCMEKFRSWEAENRVNRQRRAFLICSTVEIPPPFAKCSIVQPPHGFDGVLGKPVKWNELNKMLRRNRERSFDIVVRK